MHDELMQKAALEALNMYSSDPVYRDAIDDIGAILRPVVGILWKCYCSTFSDS